MAGPEAKAGIKNEDHIANALNHFRGTKAKKWLGALGYNVKTIKKLKADRSLKIIGKNIKSDIILRVNNRKLHGIQVKKSRNDTNFHHVQRGWADKICKGWNAPIFISNALEKFAGQNGFQPADYMSKKELKKLQSERRKKGFPEKKIKDLARRKRILLSELEEKERKKVFAWLKKNKKKIVDSVLCGNGKKYRPRHLMVTEYTEKVKGKTKVTRIGIVRMSRAVNHFAKGDVAETKGGTVLRIGKIMMQRHGAEKSEGKNAQHLQFKINPLGVFDLQSCEIFPKKKPKKTKRGK